jgi:hypothetical protein
LYSQNGVRPPSQQFASNPPLPHQPQAHFYNLPDFDLGLNNVPSEGITAGESGFFCGFDTMSMAGDDPSRSAENVLLVGSQGGLDVFRVEKSKMDSVGYLEGLRGSVIGAKVLPWTLRRDPLSASRPLVALTLHGPVLNDRSSNGGSVVDDTSSDTHSHPGSNPTISNYQTTVEIYSLKEKRKLATLYESPLIPIAVPFDSPIFQPPPPAGDFVVDAKGKFVVVASGASGEVFIFSPYLRDHEDWQEKFHCIGKVWTSVQFRERVSTSSASSAADGSLDEVPPEKYGVPVFSLSDRWLAVTPPSSTALFPVNGTALVSPYYERPPGSTHHSVPPQPSANCAVDAPEAASLLNTITREGTQVAIMGARWATDKGIQAFKSYMNKGASTNGNANSSPYGAEPTAQYFPPTHGHTQAQPRQESTVISILDLQRLHDAEEGKNKSALHPLATIPAAMGCSHLSFSPSGLMLMTVSRKGDFQHVWDLKRINFRRARKSVREQPSGPHVRQVASFARMTVANVVDVVWSAPRTDKLAVITDKGTVHMFLMPTSAFQWPPYRRIRKSAPTAQPKDDTTNAGRGGAIKSAMQAVNGTAGPLFNALRSRNTGSGGFSLSSLGIAPAVGAKSGKAVAAGVGKSINNIRHAGDNKLTLPMSPSGVKPYSVRWLTGKGRGHVALVAGGTLHIYRVSMRPATSKGKSANQASISKRKLVDFGLGPIRDMLVAPSIAAQLSAQPGELGGPETTQEIHGDWLPRSLPTRRGQRAPTAARHITSSPAPLSFAEIETNPPYQPFYTDRRVTRHVYSRPLGQSRNSESEPLQAPDLASDLHEADTSPWLFGEDIEAIRIMSQMTQAHDSGEDDVVAGLAARMENKLVLRDGEEEEQVVITTRRRRARKDGMEEDEEGFFEDDCEVLDFAEDRV